MYRTVHGCYCVVVRPFGLYGPQLPDSTHDMHSRLILKHHPEQLDKHACIKHVKSFTFADGSVCSR